MTGKSLLWLVLLLGLVACAFFVWPTAYYTTPPHVADDGTVTQERVNRFTDKTERRYNGGPWLAFMPDSTRPNRGWTPGAREVESALKAGEDIQKMQDVTEKEIEKLRQTQKTP